MTGPKVDIGRDLVCFVAAQASFATTDVAGESYPEAADAIRVITGSAGGTIPTVPREDKFGTASAVPGIKQKRTAEGSIEAYVMPSGTITVAPDIDELLTSGGWTKIDRSATATTSGASSTAVVLDCTSVTGFAVGDAIIVERLPALYEARRIVSIYAPSDQITVEPPLTFVPVTGANIKGAIGYTPSDSRDTSEDALSLWLLNNNSADRIASWTPGSYSFTMGGDDAARVSISGTGREHDRLFQTFCNTGGTLNSTDTTFEVGTGLASSGDLVNTYWLIDDEVLKIESISGNDWTVATRGSTGLGGGNTTHADLTAIRPYRPTGTYAGAPVPATSGQIVFAAYGDSTATTLQANSATLDCSFGLTTRDDIQGDAFKVGGYTMNQREVRATLSGWTLKSKNMIAEMAAFGATATAGANSQQISVASVVGEVEGSIFGWVAPRMRTEDVSLDRGSEEVTLDLTGLCEGTSSGADEILLIFA
tara:strand:+ start:220 stop:1659 length:1440 start_codon:yes stop_codon:yes gene_type:complete